MKGLTVASLKKHPSLIPLLAAIGIGGIGASAYLLRLATQNPDVTWDRSKGTYPWQRIKSDQQYKLYSVNMDYKNMKPPAERPDI